jgi:hypothetical protein
MHPTLRLLAVLLAGPALAGPAAAQNFVLKKDTSTAAFDVPKGPYFVLAPPAAKLRFTLIPPARKMFVDRTGNIALFPALFPDGVAFHRLDQIPPGFFADRFQGAFTTWRVGDFYLALQAGYTLYSATIRDGRLFVLARDKDGDFVALTPDHLALARADGTPLVVTEAPGQPAIVSVLVDRSASIAGYDTDIAGALATLSATLVAAERCALYEFGQWVRVVQAPSRETCGVLFARYRVSEPNGGTPLFEAMARAYADLAREDALAALIVVSDGAPTDNPGPGLAEAAARTPTFVLWVGSHTTDYIARYSTAHAVSRTGARREIEDFLNAISLSVKGHQTFRISAP